MQASQTQLLPFFEGKKQFVTPIYQRPYSWTREQCEQLWNDILTAGTNEKMSSHFVGSIVFIQAGLYQTSKMTALLVIDGQQRLTTISLLLIALAQLAKKSKIPMEISRAEIYDLYLTNQHSKDEHYYKLILTQNDKEDLKTLIDHPSRITKKSIDSDKGRNRIFENYLFFKEKLEESNIDPQSVYMGISKLVIVEISLDRDHDNPQLIFESMNSTGVDLTQSDLIRNFIFMGLTEEEQRRIYKSYWSPIEQSFKLCMSNISILERRRLARYSIGSNVGSNDLFDHFMREYLIVSSRILSPFNKIYVNFKKYRQRNGDASIESIASEIYRYATYYTNIFMGQNNDPEIDQIINDLKSMDSNLPYSLFLEAYEQYATEKLTREDFINLLRFVESYLFRRVICSVPSLVSGLNRLIVKMSDDKENFIQNFYALVTSEKDEYMRMPTDEEFKAAFIAKDVYSHPFRSYLFRKLENYRRKEFVNIESYTIEHIMPQSISKSEIWKKELGPDWKKVHSRWLHTIGNLTLTGYNSELSNRSFLEKRDMEGGFADSPIRLNRMLAKLEHWNESEIQNRAVSLAEQALQIWPASGVLTSKSKITSKPDKKPKAKTYTLADYPNLKNENLALFDLLRRRILNLDAVVTEEMQNARIVYSATTDFAYVKPLDVGLKINLLISYRDIRDMNNLGRAVGELDSETELTIQSESQVDDAVFIIRQSFEKHWDAGDA